MVSYEHKVKNIYLGSPYEEGTPIIPGDYTLLRGPCDEGFHVPLIEERQAIKNQNISVSDFITYLHIPTAGCKNYGSGNSVDSGTSSYLRTSSIDTNSKARYLILASSGRYLSSIYRTSGNNIRAFRNTPIIPDETRTETLSGKVWYNSDLGLISVLVGTNQYVTLQDKNVGATVVYNYQDTFTNDNRGKYYQRGNNYGFPRGTITKSTELVDASNYGPSNPYSSSTFITNNSGTCDWSSVQNDNLRGYTDFNS